MLVRLPDGTSIHVDPSLPPSPQDKEHELIVLLVQMLRPQIAVEVGSLYGNTTVCMAYALPPGGRVWSLDLHTEWADAVIDAYGLRDRIVQVRGDSRQTIPTLPDGIEFAFIDGDHGYGAVKADAEGLWPKMAPGGIMAFHDVWPMMNHDDPLWAPPLGQEIEFVTDVRRYLREAHPTSAIHLKWGQGIALVQRPIV